MKPALIDVDCSELERRVLAHMYAAQDMVTFGTGVVYVENGKRMCMDLEAYSMEDIVSPTGRLTWPNGPFEDGYKGYRENRFREGIAPLFPVYHRQRKTFKEFLKDSVSSIAMNASYDGVTDVPELEIIR